MPRPFMQHGVTQLEQLFQQSRSDPAVLKQLEQELRYRQVPRAIALLAEVQAAMYGASDKPSGASPATRAPAPTIGQSNLFPTSPDLPGGVEAPAGRAAPPDRALGPGGARSRPCGDSELKTDVAFVPTMSIEEACKLLKTSLGATWESIEESRRKLVQPSSPTRTRSLGQEDRAGLLAKAKRVNAAYATLFHARLNAR